MEQCSQSILTSGLTFFVATASVAAISRMELISSLCLLISRGALISMAVILLVLPALLIVTAPVIRKTTYHWLVKRSVRKMKRCKKWLACLISLAMASIGVTRLMQPVRKALARMKTYLSSFSLTVR